MEAQKPPKSTNLPGGGGQTRYPTGGTQVGQTNPDKVIHVGGPANPLTVQQQPYVGVDERSKW